MLVTDRTRRKQGLYIFINMSKKKNKLGEKYHRLLVTEELESKREPSGRLRPRVKVRCDCGVEKETCYKQLSAGRIKSCGCYSEEYSESIRIKIEVGQEFSLWKVIEEGAGYFDKKGSKSDRTFLCRCVCGKEKEVNLQSLVKGQSKSCGCQGRPKKEVIVKEKIIPKDTEEEQWKECISFENYYISTKGKIYAYKWQKIVEQKNQNTIEIRHKQTTIIKEMYRTFIGEYDQSVYNLYYLNNIKDLKHIRLRETSTERVRKLRNVYNNMKDRCYKPNNKSYSTYGAKGITIEESLNTPYKFIDWAIEQGYQPGRGLEIDRIDSNKGYSIENCRWVTKIENGLNVNYINLTLEDVRWIRSDNFTYEEAMRKFIASRHTIENIREYRTFVEVPSF